MPRAIAVTAVLAGLLLLSGCGLEAFILLNPPEPVDLGNDDKFTFRATADNAEGSFKGFEVYYKIHEVGVAPDTSTITTIEELIISGFRRINRFGESPGAIAKPLIQPASSDVGSTYLVTIDFSINVVDPVEYPKITTSAATPKTYTKVCRGIAPSPGNYKRFIKAEFSPSPEDADIIGLSAEILAGTQIGILCVALSYGIDVSNGLEVYSQPVSLYDEDLQFPY